VGDVGGVGGPVAGCRALPLDGDTDVDSEHACEQCGREFLGELEKGRGPGLAGVDADGAESFGEPERTDRVSWPSAGEEPRRGVGGAEGCVSLAVCDHVEDEVGKGFG
jgi:hypothetical protein